MRDQFEKHGEFFEGELFDVQFSLFEHFDDFMSDLSLSRVFSLQLVKNLHNDINSEFFHPLQQYFEHTFIKQPQLQSSLIGSLLHDHLL